MRKLFYPAVFHEAEEGGFWITFPDFKGIFTQADTMDEAYEMSKDALGLEIADLQEQGSELPVASNPSRIHVKKGESIVIIEFDLLDYLQRHDSRAIKKTLTIPNWLNKLAVAKGLNFSSILQQALMKEMNIL
jgi:predicted RNase H-like HicB family nuclease